MFMLANASFVVSLTWANTIKQNPQIWLVVAPSWLVVFLPQISVEDEDDFLRGEMLQTEGVVGMTPGSYESHLRSPSSVGSPPIAFLQRRFWSPPTTTLSNGLFQSPPSIKLTTLQPLPYSILKGSDPHPYLQRAL